MNYKLCIGKLLFHFPHVVGGLILDKLRYLLNAKQCLIIFIISFMSHSVTSGCIIIRFTSESRPVPRNRCALCTILVSCDFRFDATELVSVGLCVGNMYVTVRTVLIAACAIESKRKRNIIVYESDGAVAVYKEGHCQVAKSGVVVTLVKMNKLAPIQVRTWVDTCTILCRAVTLCCQTILPGVVLHSFIHLI